MSEDSNELSEVESIKQASRGLRGTIAPELAMDTAEFTEEARQILKFHGTYQQDDRDQRRARKKAGLEPAHSFMIRSKIPGGVLSAEQYLIHDALAVRFGNGTLRVTTRQDIQLHGVVKHDLRESMRTLNQVLVTTLGACGDINRNVISCPVPEPNGVRADLLRHALALSEHLLPRTRAYHELWLDGERLSGATEDDPIYGDRYLPRKFKIGLAMAEDNCTDVYANDLGFLALTQAGSLAGYNVLVGGGLGQTHGKDETYPRLASALAFITPDELIAVGTAVLTVQRDHGNRVNRRRARLKYLIDERGLEWFKGAVEERVGRSLEAPADMAVSAVHDHLGWHRQKDGEWYYGLFIENGRIRDAAGVSLRSAIRKVVEDLRPGVHLTPQQNLIFSNIPATRRALVDRILSDHGVSEHLSVVRRWSMACPALPTCSLAVAESERALPGVIDQLEVQLARLGLGDVPITVRMTGCPNGCARPYTAELAFVGRTLDKYVVYAGGNFEGTRLAQPIADLVKRDDLVATVIPLLEQYRRERLPAERFGDFCHRTHINLRQPIQEVS
jgi:sulfite reductase (ferredoxin)